MKLIFGLALLSILFSLGESSNETSPCTPGTTRPGDDCYSCLCKEDGVNEECFHGCPKEFYKKKCDEGLKSFNDGCNSVFCQENGSIGSTLMACFYRRHFDGTIWKKVNLFKRSIPARFQ